MISNNLERSGLFSVLPKKLFFNLTIPFEEKPTFSDWKITTAQGLVHGKLKIKNGKLNLVLIDKNFNAFTTSKFNNKNILRAFN